MLTIHGIPISVHVRKVLVTANLKAISHRVEPVIPFNPPSGWGTLSPTGLIPAMTDGDFSIAESTAICSYLEAKTTTPTIFSADARDQSRVLFFDGYAGHMFRSLVHGLFFQKIINPGILKGQTDQSIVDNLLNTVRPKTFGYLESQITGKYLVGNALTLADIAVASNLINYQYLGLAIDPKTYPKLAQYAAGVAALDVFKSTLANERPFADQMGLDSKFLS